MRVLTDHKPFVTIRTPIGECPRLWLEYVEPKILRRDTCWLWADALGPRDCAGNGEPRMRFDGSTILVKHFVAGIFYTTIQCRGHSPRHYVYHECGNVTCINPAHFICCYDTAQQFDLAGMVKAKRAHLQDHINRKKKNAIAP